MPTIPKGLKPVVEGYTGGAPDGVLRTEVAGGAPRYGLEWDRGTQQFRVTLILNEVQFAIWTTFFHHVVKKGAISFEMDLDSGYGVGPHSVNIVPGTYAFTRTQGVLTSVTFTVEAESEAYTMSTADAEALLEFYDLYGAESNALLQAIDLFANQHTLVLIAP